MQRLIIIIYFIQFICFQQTAQQRVSDIQDIVSSYSFTNYFHLILNEKYLIQMNAEETRISIVKNDSILIQHQLFYRPLDESKIYVSDPCHQNRPLVFNDSLLLEFYSQSIYITNLKNGKLYKIIDMRNENIILNASDIQFFNNKLFFTASKAQLGNRHCFIDMLNYTFFLSDFLTSTENIRLNDKIYKFHGNEIFSFDISNNKDSTLYFQQTNSINYSSSFYTDCEKKIVFGNQNVADYYVVNTDHSLIPLGCNLKGNMKNFYMKDSVIAYSYILANGEYMQIYDIKNCKPINLDLDKGQYKIHDIKGLSSEYILISNIGNYITSGEHFLIDTKLGVFHVLSSITDTYLDRIVEYYNGVIYIAGIDEIELYGSVYSLNAIDLNSKSPRVIKTITNEDVKKIILSPIKNGRMHIISTSFSNKVDFFYYLPPFNTATRIKSLLVNSDLGISNVYKSKLINDKLFFSIQNGIYVTHGDKTTKIFECVYTSDFILYNNILYVLVKQINNVTGYLKIDINNYANTFTIIPNLNNIDYSTNITEYVFINDRNKDNNGNFLLDVRTELYRNIEPTVGDNRVWVRAISGNNLFIYNYGNNFQNKYYHIFNTETYKLVYLQELDNKYFDIYSDNEGGFIIVQNNGSKDILKTIDGNGYIETYFELPAASKYQFNGDKGLDGEIKTIPIQGLDSIIFASIKNGKAYKTSIPYYNPLNYIPFFWKEVGDILVTEVFDEEGKNYQYVYKLGEEPILIPSNINHLTLESAIIDGEDIILFLEKVQTRELKIIHYNYATKSIINIIEKPASLINYYTNSNIQIKISENKYLLSFNDGLFGRELWIYDKSQHTFELYKDVKPGYISSTPEFFTEIEEYIYFIARADNDSRQWFRVKGELSNVKDEAYPEKAENFLYPNPTKNHIIFKKDIKEIEIFNNHGKLVMSFKNIEANEIFSLGSLTSGVYLVKANYENKYFYNKLIIHKD